MNKIKTWWNNFDWFTAIMISVCVAVFAVCGAIGYWINGTWWATLLGGALGIFGLFIVVLIGFFSDSGWNN